MVVGARTKKSKTSLLRKPRKKVLSITANYLAGMRIPDLNSGFRATRETQGVLSKGVCDICNENS